MSASLRIVRATEPVPGPPEYHALEAGPADRGWDIKFAFGVALLAGLLALWSSGSSLASSGQGLARLPPVERAALFERTRANVAVVCNGDPAFRDMCRDEALLLRLFPECDAACRAAAQAALPRPTR